MLFTTEQYGEVTIIRATVPAPPQFEDRAAYRRAFAETVLAAPTKRLVVNLRGAPLWDHLSLGVLASTQRQLERLGFRVRLCGLSPETRWALEAEQLIDLFDISSDEQSAIDGLQDAGPP